jgi:hypothetical protein
VHCLVTKSRRLIQLGYGIAQNFSLWIVPHHGLFLSVPRTQLRNTETLAFKCECDKAAYLRPTSCAYSIEEAFQSDSNRTDFRYYLLSSAHIFIGFSCWKAFAEEDPKKSTFFQIPNFRSN